MTTGENQDIQLKNETALNVATFLQEDVGSTRTVELRNDTFLLDEGLVARDLVARVRLTRLRQHILADGEMQAEVELECVRCLNQYDQDVTGSFSEQYRQLHDVRSGAELSDHREFETDEDPELEDEVFAIDESHVLDLAEALRQNLVLAMPMTPVCGDDCPGPPEQGHDDEDTDAEEREGQFDVLADLLDDDDTDNERDR